MGFFTGDDDKNYDAAMRGAGDSQRRYDQFGNELSGALDATRRRATGEDSLSAEALRQGLQQNLSAQRSMAASASPQNNTIAALTASRNAMNLGAGMSGAAAQAGIMERQAAESQLVQAMLERQRMEQQGAMGYRQIAAANKPQSWLDRFGGAVTGGARLIAGM